MSEISDGTGDRRQPRRWRVLAAVTSVQTPATVDEIADVLHDRRAPSDPLAGLESWDRTHQRLHDVDLPALSAAGLVEFDRDRGIVTVPPAAAESGFGARNVEATHQRRRVDAEHTGGVIETEPATRGGPGGASRAPSQATTQESETGSPSTSPAAPFLPWHHLYLGATVVSALLVVGSMDWAIPGPEYPPTLAAATAVALFGTLAIGHQLVSAR